MLDVRITGYVVPLAEQPQASLTPVIAVSNVADEDAVITGLIRIYRESTGLLIYDSRLAVTQLEHHTSANIAALTPFDPPAPADDDYFVKADLVATSYLPGPPLSVTLGAWHFDIKTPAMGAAPAGHHGTHETLGSDEIDVTDLAGLLADCQTPCAHAASHELGGSDELDVTGLTGAGGGGHIGLYAEHEFLNHDRVYPWLTGTAISGGGESPVAAEPNHPGIARHSSSTTANSGWRVRLDPNSIRIAGVERSDFIIRPQTLLGTKLFLGFHDASSTVNPVDGVYFRMSQVAAVDGVLEGVTASNNVRSYTATNFTLVSTTWYRLRIVVNVDATRVDYYLYAEDGTQLWTDNLVANIPNAAGRETGHGIISVNSGTSAVALCDYDNMTVEIPRVFVR